MATKTKVTGLTAWKRRVARLELALANAAHDEQERSMEIVVRKVKNDYRQVGAPGARGGSAPADFEERRGGEPASRSAPASDGRKSNPKHKPSNPYQPPNSDTGLAMDSFSSFRQGDTVFAGSPVRYVRMVELGTRNIKPRPALIPRYLEELPNFRRRIKAVFKQLQRKI